MRRQLTPREWILLGVLGVLALVSGYVLLFYMPVTAQRDQALAETELCRMELETAQIRVEEKRRMERELEEIFARTEQPLSLAAYDNLQPVMLELHGILSAAEDYALTFGTVDAQGSIVRRSISLTFTSGSYDGAKNILWQLHESAYRCMLENITVSLNTEAEETVSVSGTIVFFEYQKGAGDTNS